MKYKLYLLDIAVIVFSFFGCFNANNVSRDYQSHDSYRKGLLVLAVPVDSTFISISYYNKNKIEKWDMFLKFCKEDSVDSDSSSKLVTLELENGEYNLFQIKWTINGVQFWVDSLIPFEIISGKVTYIGKLNYTITDKNIILGIKDNSFHDIPLLMRLYRGINKEDILKNSVNKIIKIDDNADVLKGTGNPRYYGPPQSSIYLGANIIRSGVTSDDFSSTGKRFTATDNNDEDGLILLPEIEAGYGYEILLGGKWENKKNHAAAVLELSYLNARHKANYLNEPLNVIYQGIDFNGRFYFCLSNPVLLCFSLGVPLYTSLKVENGSYKLENNQPTKRGDVTYYGGLITFPYGFPIAISIGAGLTCKLSEYLSLELMYTRRAVRYHVFSGVMGNMHNIQNVQLITLTGPMYETSSVYTTYSSLQLGLKYSFYLF